MRTSPAFQFYPADFLNGTMLMSAEEVGAYIRMLSYQWQQGSCPTDAEDLAKITGLSAKKLARRVLSKFEETPEGFKNRRLEDARSEIEEFRQRQSHNGKKGGRPKKPVESQKNPSLSSGFDLENPNKSSHTHTQSHTQSQDNPHTPHASARTDGVWPDPREYPTLETVKAWAVAVMAPTECAEKWHAEKVAEGWLNRHNQPYHCTESALRPLFTSYATAWKARAAQGNGRASGYQKPKANAYDIPARQQEIPSEPIEEPANF